MGGGGGGGGCKVLEGEICTLQHGRGLGIAGILQQELGVR